MWKLDSYTCIQICFTKDASNEEEIAFIFPLLCGLRHGQMMYFKEYFALAERGNVFNFSNLRKFKFMQSMPKLHQNLKFSNLFS